MTTLPVSTVPAREAFIDTAQPLWLRSLSASALALMTMSLLVGCQSMQTDPSPPSRLIEGVVWQLDNNAIDARGNWQDIGAKRLLVQWLSVDGISFLPDAGQPTAPRLPDWQRIAGEPWAREVILGLAGRFDEASARADVVNLIAQSERLAKLPIPLNVVGWYFPVEIDSSWNEAKTLGHLLSRLPRPLWISVYDRANIGAEPLARWLDTWLPADVAVFFQDGVGVHARTAAVARQYVEALSRQLGARRVSVIAEAFRPKPEGGFRSATLEEISVQLQTYRGLPVYLFDGPHYVSNTLVKELQTQRARSSSPLP